MKTAIVYDRVNKWGGAERVLLALHELFPEAPLYTSVYDKDKAPWVKVFPKVIPSFLQKIPGANSRHEWLAAMMPIAFETLDFTGYDLVISVTSEAAKGIITRPPTLHICYCLTPTRYLWSHYDDYFKGRYFKGITRPIVSYLRAWDKVAAQRPDVMVGISTTVKERIKKYYGRESELIYPPVDVERFQNSKTLKLKIIKNLKLKNKNYYLIVSRLVPYKKVDLALDAFAELGLPLVVVGTGSEEKKYKSKFKFKNITFRGFVEDELPGLYRGARAFIHPQEEDFGIGAVEAQAAGVPVIAYKKGGSLDTVIEGKTGLFFDSQTVESLVSVVRRFDDSNHRSNMRIECVKNAQRFSKGRFKKDFLDLTRRKV